MGPVARVARASWENAFAGDAWVVVVVRGDGDLFPVVGKGGITPRAFTNPILVDVSGDGWTPPLDLAAERARVGSLATVAQPLRAPPTEAELRALLAHGCSDEE